jgi:hypothetical protein
MRLAIHEPLTEQKEAAIIAAGGTQDLIDELNASEMWRNDQYVVTVTRRDDNSVSELSIRRDDRSAAVHDWRQFQMIKNEIAGPEVEAFEIYPRESRLMDTANQYYLWVLPPGQTIPAGYFGGRATTEEAEGIGSVNRPMEDAYKNGASDQ